MRHVDDTQAGFLTLVRNIEDAAPVGTRLDRQPLTSVPVATEVAVANEDHVFLFSGLLSVSSRDQDRRGNRNMDDREKDSARCNCAPREESPSTWGECWQTRRVPSSRCNSQELSSEISQADWSSEWPRSCLKVELQATFSSVSRVRRSACQPNRSRSPWRNAPLEGEEIVVDWIDWPSWLS
jgi:hypothetical protein